MKGAEAMFKTDYKVTVKDINYGGHMGNEVPLLLFHQVRIEFLNSLGLSELNIGEDIGTIQRESYIKYNKEVFLGERLTLIIENIEVEKVSLKFSYKIFNEREENVVEGNTLMLAYNYNMKKVSRVPESFKKILEERR